MIVKCAECGQIADTTVQAIPSDWYVAALARAWQAGDLSAALFYCGLRCVMAKVGRELPRSAA